ncbi:aldo/keto reductase [Rarobacter faecitabidus]|uniref:Diketogulonate reductase-like aldo/keto reductase n=1 Tax=Rarobacter faecitabidus TaxID=13243 RepID=A0A542ZUW2_RARFA|nr:aldo/keto reductase [Rarobacter faecitabidus]TQL64148.1 diketogulonate reductase-like aldo/keto reductase [Rarobacter faecitabidus]
MSTHASRSEVPALALNDGSFVPAVGLGTYKLNGTAGATAIGSAIDQGYRLLDSAFNYENEGAVGRGVRESDVPREQLIVTSKLPGRHHDHDSAILTVQESVYRTGLDYIDLYLIHWPNPKVGKFVEAYRALIEMRDAGLIKAVGVSNFLPEHLDAVIEATGVAPVVNQIELHPYFPQLEVIEANRARGVQTESWSPVGRGNSVAAEPIVQEIAAKHGKSPVQVILRWHTQLGTIPLPKSANASRQRENLELFDFTLSEGDMAAITSLGRPDGRLAGQDPAEYEEF